MFLTTTDQSSTALHILLRSHLLYTFFWFIVEILCFVFKYYHLTYSASAFGLEISIVIILAFNDLLRQFFGIKGNLTLDSPLLIIFIVYGLFCAVGFVFLLILQSYVQRVEIFLSGISLLLIIIEVLLSIITLIRSRRAMPVLTKLQQIDRFNQAQKRFQSAVKTEWGSGL